LRRQGSLVFCMHLWEIDPDQPRVREVKASFRLCPAGLLLRSRHDYSINVGANNNN
jgi:hypothetical protein